MSKIDKYYAEIIYTYPTAYTIYNINLILNLPANYTSNSCIAYYLDKHMMNYTFAGKACMKGKIPVPEKVRETLVLASNI